MNPSAGVIRQRGNQIRALPEDVTKHEARLESARQKAVDARQALEVAHWEV